MGLSSPPKAPGPTSVGLRGTGTLGLMERKDPSLVTDRAGVEGRKLTTQQHLLLRELGEGRHRPGAGSNRGLRGTREEDGGSRESGRKVARA